MPGTGSVIANALRSLSIAGTAKTSGAIRAAANGRGPSTPCRLADYTAIYPEMSRTTSVNLPELIS
jgi:hypothetical protein